MKRRTFIKDSTLTAFSIAAFGAIQWNGDSFTGDTETTTDILGPFYRPGAPVRNNLIPPGSTGQPVNFNGTVFKADGKTPMADALIESWQCDEHEHYDNASDEYLYRGALRTGKDGKYAFKTIVPVPYKNGDTWRPAHIHLRVSSNDHQDLITQIYLKGDPHIQEDECANSPQAVGRVLTVSKNASGENAIRFDIVMGKSFPLSDAGYKTITGLYQLKDGTAEFIRKDDLLFLKINGQYMEGMTYKGENSFSGGVGVNRVRFELLPDGGVKCNLNMWDYSTDKSGAQLHEGIKVMKYTE
jgi:catechol 1,2-dioxygenase